MNFKKSDYSKKLLDPRWQKLRLEILERDEWACRACGDKKKTLHVHHTHYIQGLEPWEYVDETQFLVTLCCDCHEEETGSLKSSKENLFSSLSSLGIYLSLHIDAIANALNNVPAMTTEEVIAFSGMLSSILNDRLDHYVRDDNSEKNLWVQVMNNRKPF